ncbi:putative P-loop containing nucleoside triphosphatehydrolase [Vibrio phage 501E54-1]|nr:putative P-loop containing nucleoside triphosphatehydrolase [Vibrio phage 501E54-1]
MLKVVVMNAKYPRSGKDTAADHMVDLINSDEETFLPAFKKNFKDKLITATAKMLCIDEWVFLKDYDSKTVDVKESEYMFGDLPEWWKDVPLYMVNGRMFSKREALIYCSEELFKVMLGDRVFGDMLVADLPKEGVVFVGDSGFVSELLPVIEKVGVENVLVCRVHRDLKSDVYDSRSMLTEEMFEEKTCPTFIDVYNDGTEDQFKAMVTFKIGSWLNG